MKNQRKYADLSLEEQLDRIHRAWYEQSGLSVGPMGDSYPIKVFTDHVIVQTPEGLFNVPYTVGEDDAITFSEAQKVQEVFIPARDPKNPASAVVDWLGATYRLLSGQQPTPEKSGTPAQLPSPVADGEGVLLSVPFAVYSEDDDEERYVGGLVLTPGDDNAYGDVWAPQDIRVLAHRFMEKSRHIDIMHTTKVVATPVESVYFPTEEEGGQKEYTFYGTTIPAGSWWLGTRVQDDEAWAAVKAGQLKGFSMFAVRTRMAQSQVNRAYVTPEARSYEKGRQMLASEWDITMVALVDQPAVPKATYVILRRAPDGSTELVDRKGKEITHGGAIMKGLFRRFAAYNAGQDDGTEPDADPNIQPNSDPPGDGTPQATPPADTAAPDPDPKVMAAAEDGASDGEPTNAQVLEAVNAMSGKLDTVLQSLQANAVQQAVEQAVESTLENGLKPVQEAVAALSAKYGAIAGMGALPGHGINGNDPDNDKAHEGSELPSWANVSGRKRQPAATK